MASSSLDPIKLMVEIINANSPEDMWVGTPLQAYRLVGMTNRGEIGEQFIHKYLKACGIETSNVGNRTSITDMLIAGHPFEVKTASLGKNRTFQFNHIRLDRKYGHLLCLGVCPSEVVFGMWSKGDVAEEKAGTLVRMAEGQSVTFKLTKRLASMRPITELPELLRTEFNL